MPETKLHMCFEGKNSEEDPLYLIYSVTQSAYEASGASPSFNLEKVIAGNRSMGCGVFGSKIVFAGGLVKGQEKEGEKSAAVISYDMNTKEVSFTDIPVMRGGKFQPVVLQLNKKLYVLDTGNNIHRRSFEIYFPEQKIWHRLNHPYYNYSPYAVHTFSGGWGFSYFVFGKCLCISFRHARKTYLHHSKHCVKEFRAAFFESTPFHGMATTYSQSGYDDLALISFNNGRVEGRQLDLSSRGFRPPKFIFKAECSSRAASISSSQPASVRHYFANFGHGNYCLAVSDSYSIHIYMFKISRCQSVDGSLNLKLLRKYMHRYDLGHFCREGQESFRIIGCFAHTSEVREEVFKEDIEAKLYAHKFRLFSFEEEDDDCFISDDEACEAVQLNHQAGAEEPECNPRADSEGSHDDSSYVTPMEYLI